MTIPFMPMEEPFNEIKELIGKIGIGGPKRAGAVNGSVN